MSDSKFNNIHVEGRVSQTLAAAGAEDLVRLQEFAQQTSGLAPLVHTHVLDDITDFNGKLAGRVKLRLVDTLTIAWLYDSGAGMLSGVARLGEGLFVGPNGITIDFGLAHAKVARGDHTHSQLHDAVTTDDSDTLIFNLTGQELTGAVRLKPAGGLISNSSGIATDFGTGTNQSARGDHTHALLHLPASALSTPTLNLFCDPATQQISGSLILTDDAGISRAPVKQGLNGLYIQLGTTAKVAAEGNHVHDPVTNSSAGFMSAAEHLAFGRLESGVSSQTLVFNYSGSDWTAEVKRGTNSGLKVVSDGLAVDFGTGPNQAPRGDHVHAVATNFAAGFMAAAEHKTLGLLSGVEQIVGYVHHHSSGVRVGDYIGGRARFATRVELMEINVTCQAPKLPQRLTLEVAGVATAQHIWLSGVFPLEINLQKELDYTVELAGARTDYARWVCDSGVQASEVYNAQRVTLNLTVRPIS